MSLIPSSVEEMIAVGLLPYPVKSIEKHGEGLINNTFKIVTKNPEDPNFLLQKINRWVFKDIDALQQNIRLITGHIRKKLEQEKSTDIFKKVLTPSSILSNGASKSYYWDHNNDFWRMYVFIEDSVTHEKVLNKKMAESAGKAMATFHKQLLDFKSDEFKELLPDFHHAPRRVVNLKIRIKEDIAGRLKNVKEEVDFLLSREKIYSKVANMGDKNILPLRLIHQDPKLNNILFDKKENPLCIIDLDTVMHGYLCYDIGDAIRYCANTGKEDDENLENISLDMKIFKSYMDGYASIAKDFVTWAEMESLAFGPRLLTYEQSVRFLADYLYGDKYYKYKTLYPEHNLVRARAQIKLLKSMEENYEEMAAYVRTLGNWEPFS
ncbi:MAG: aminoglycoside phosphotransferase family protein [Bacteroidales bacterium]